ncbi:hypothetical protein M3Y99_01862200 [Aphelenchoides fujianensis]|nr:hypothetical protein M3Y99_01862200 [Aphelenchoides fujianensis]
MERADVRLKSAVKQRNSEDEHDALLRKALEEARVEAAKEEDAHKKMESTSAEKQQDEKKPASDEKADDGEKIDCDPHVKCCPRPGPNARSARLHNCVMGFRVSGDGRQIACLSEEYCASSAAMAAGNGAFGRCFSLATGLLSVSAAAFWILFSE